MARSVSPHGAQKAAILMISLGPEVSARIFRHLRDDEIERITLEIANQRQIAPEVKEKVMEEFHSMCLAQNYISQGGIEYAKEILEKALGENKAIDIISRLTSSLQVRPFDFARRTDPNQLLNFIQNEHPQTIALVMAHLHPEQSAAILSSLAPEIQIDVTKRIATMDRTSPEIIREVERVLEDKVASLAPQDFTTTGGVGSVVDILNRVDRGTERTIMNVLEVKDPGLAEEIKRRMFVFEDIVSLDDRSIQRVLREIDLSKDLPLALKTASEDVKEKITKNLSKRAVETLEENIGFLGPVRLRDIEDAQQKIVNIIRKLEEQNEIIIARGGGDELII